MKHVNSAVIIKAIAMLFVFSFLFVMIAFSQTPKPTQIPGSTSITYDTVNSKYIFYAVDVTYTYDLIYPNPIKGTLTALVAFKGDKYVWPSYNGGIVAILNNIEKGDSGFYNVTYDLLSHRKQNDTVFVSWRMRYGGDSCDYKYKFSLSGQTLIINFEGDNSNKICRVSLNCAFSHNSSNYVVPVPCFTLANVLYNDWMKAFVTMFTDWETTNASGIKPLISGENRHDLSYYSQKIFYEPKTDGIRNKLNETIYLSVANDINNVLPNIVGPVAPRRGKLSDKFYISYFPPFPALNHPALGTSNTYLCDLYNCYGIRDVAFIVKNWSNGQFDYGWPDNWHADDFTENKGYGSFDPPEGGTVNLLKIRDSISTKSFLFGLHEDYVIAHPSSLWQKGLLPSGNPAKAFYMSIKGYPQYAQTDYLLSPSQLTQAVQANKSNMTSSGWVGAMPDFSYLDFGTALNPSGTDRFQLDTNESIVDFNNALGENAGKFRYTMSKYRDLADTVSSTYNNCPVQGEGGHQFLYAGYYDDFDGRNNTGDGRIYGYKAPLLIEFAQKIREKSSSHGVGHIHWFFGYPEGNFQNNIDSSMIKTFIATELAYGNGGLVTTGVDMNYWEHSRQHAFWEQHYLLWIEKMYANAKPIKTEYYDIDGFTPYTVSNYIKNHLVGFDDVNSNNFMGRVRVVYDNGLEVWVNRTGNPWALLAGGNGFYCYNITINEKDTIGLGGRPQGLGTSPQNPFVLPSRNGWLCYSQYWPNGAVWSGPKVIPDSIGSESRGGGIATAKINNNNNPDLVAFWMDKSSGHSIGKYRIGWDLNSSGDADHWTGVPSGITIGNNLWWGDNTEASDIAIAKMGWNFRPDFILFWIDSTNGISKGFFRIGKDMSTSGTVSTSNWLPYHRVGDTTMFWGSHIQGAGVAIADINKNGKNDLLFFWIEHIASDYNKAYYIIGWDFNATTGTVSSWSPDKKLVGNGNDTLYWGVSPQGAGIAIADFNSNNNKNLPDIVFGWVDNRFGNNWGNYRIGWDIDTLGNIDTVGYDLGIISDSLDSDEHQGAGIVIDSINSNSKKDLIFFSISNPVGENKAFYRVGYDVGVTPPPMSKSNTNLLSDNALPTEFQLSQNYPNPFNPSTTIEYAIPKDSKVTLILYDILGREVQRLVDGFIRAGYHKSVLNASYLSTGVYFYRIMAGNFIQTRKLLLLK
jgi:hypothetical protein